MSEISIQIFQSAVEFWQRGERAELSPLVVEHIEAALNYAHEHPEAVLERAKQLDAAIRQFNQQRKSEGFKAADKVNSKKLATEILAVDEPLPLLGEMPQDTKTRNAFFRGFLDMIHNHYYTFLDKQELFDPKILISGLLVDGYSFALRAKRAVEHKHTGGKDDLIICNAICEMVQPGTLQEEMVKANWYKVTPDPDFSLDARLCERVKQQYS